MVWCKAHFDILNRSSVTHECVRQTDTVLANAARNYVAGCTARRSVMRPGSRTAASPSSAAASARHIHTNSGLIDYRRLLASLPRLRSPEPQLPTLDTTQPGSHSLMKSACGSASLGSLSFLPGGLSIRSH